MSNSAVDDAIATAVREEEEAATSMHPRLVLKQALQMYDARKRLRVSAMSAECMLRALMTVLTAVTFSAPFTIEHVRDVPVAEWLCEELTQIEDEIVRHNIPCTDNILMYMHAFATLLPEHVDAHNSQSTRAMRQLYDAHGLHGMHRSRGCHVPDEDDVVADDTCMTCLTNKATVMLSKECRHSPKVCATCAARLVDRSACFYCRAAT
jgi:hypothetical protein